MATTVTPARRGRPRKIESFADWMDRIDKEVDEAARKIERKPPTYSSLNSAQRKIVQVLIDHLRGLPELEPGESPFTKYDTVNRILTELFRAKFPEWKDTPRINGHLDVDRLPEGESQFYMWMLRNCACRTVPNHQARAPRLEEDDD